MKRSIAALMLSACAQHMTQPRPGFKSCAARGAAIVCAGKELARLECAEPFGESCASLSIVYAGGERVALAPHGALRPELASDGSQIWFKSGDSWLIYDPARGVAQVVEAFSILMARDRDPDAVPLWKR